MLIHMGRGLAAIKLFRLVRASDSQSKDLLYTEAIQLRLFMLSKLSLLPL
jgi:hypothetical protein